MQKILFITTNNLTTNPRLIKELKLAQANSFKSTVILFDLDNWTNGIEKDLCTSFPEVNFIYIPVTRINFYSWIKSSLLNHISNKAYSFFSSSIKITAFASDKRSFLLHQRLKEINGNKIDLVIAHNLGALYPAYQFSKRYRIPFGFDVEDFHPGEVIIVDAVNESERRTSLMRLLLPIANYVTAASPLIAKEVEKLCKVPVTTINNSFNSTEFKIETTTLFKEKVNLVWFSQNINRGRGLELLFPALDNFSDKMTLTLIGNLNPEFANTYLSRRNYITIKSPLSQKELHQELSEYDVGLALEISSVDMNKDIAFSNKIFAYKQAGLYILATDTKAQLAFMAPYKEDGKVTEQTVDALINGLQFVFENIESIRASKPKRYEQAKEIAFETEAQKLVALWRSALLKKV